MSPGFASFRKRILNRFSYRMFLLSRLPLVWISGIRVESLSQISCTTSVRYGWINRNPFGSLYFAVMQMAAELSTGALCMGNIYKSDPAVSMLVIRTQAVYTRKAKGLIRFTCNDGLLIASAAERACSDHQPHEVNCSSVAVNETGEQVAEFQIIWSFKQRQ
ncbi:MAG TPA: DUF4442 domain-containing protein [Chitinophagaceae bacterium]